MLLEDTDKMILDGVVNPRETRSCVKPNSPYSETELYTETDKVFAGFCYSCSSCRAIRLSPQKPRVITQRKHISFLNTLKYSPIPVSLLSGSFLSTTEQSNLYLPLFSTNPLPGLHMPQSSTASHSQYDCHESQTLIPSSLVPF
jgi:hypothetical protein